MRLHPRDRLPARCGLAALLLAGAGSAGSQGAPWWGIEERASEGCVEEVSLAFDAPGVLGGHGPRTLCGATPVRRYPEPLPTGILSLFWKSRTGEAHRYDVPLDTVLRRENLRMEGTVLELVYGQDTVELWSRPLSAAAPPVPDSPLDSARAAARQRLFYGGLQVMPGRPVAPGIHRSR